MKRECGCALGLARAAITAARAELLMSNPYYGIESYRTTRAYRVASDIYSLFKLHVSQECTRYCKPYRMWSCQTTGTATLAPRSTVCTERSGAPDETMTRARARGGARACCSTHSLGSEGLGLRKNRQSEQR